MSAVPPSFLILSDVHFGAFAVTKDFALATNPPKHEMRGAVPMKEALIRQRRVHDCWEPGVGFDLPLNHRLTANRAAECFSLHWRVEGSEMQ